MYLGYQNGKIKFYTEQQLDEKIYNLTKVEETQEEYVLDGDEYILKDAKWEEKQAQRENERIKNLRLTKRVFALALQEIGISYTQLKALIATNEQAQLEWDLCVELQRSNPLLDIMAAKFGLNSDIIDNIFQKANGEEVDVSISDVTLNGGEAL